jgi:hypothetical protein
VDAMDTATSADRGAGPAGGEMTGNSRTPAGA